MEQTQVENHLYPKEYEILNVLSYCEDESCLCFFDPVPSCNGNHQYKVINDVPFELLSFANPLDYAILDNRLDLVLNVRKRDLSPTALHAIALETINTRFPPEEWLHIYTDGSLLNFAQGAGIGVFSHLFSFYLHAGPLTTHFDGEVEAIHIALQQLAVRLPPIERAVILSYSILLPFRLCPTIMRIIVYVCRTVENSWER
ncbi:uncharacterized protein TNCV_1024221 [Trichonephila clavipes]|nr:uncharacterized protein TNCV_1024221 [Trichonephila clavipes]